MFLCHEVKQYVCSAQFQAKYKEDKILGKGGCGSVFAGCRQTDNLPVSVTHILSHTHTHTPCAESANHSCVCVSQVAIKHIPKEKVFCRQVVSERHQLLLKSVEFITSLPECKNKRADFSGPEREAPLCGGGCYVETQNWSIWISGDVSTYIPIRLVRPGPRADPGAGETGALH